MTTRPPRPVRQAVTLTADGGRMLLALCERLGAPASIVVELAVRQMAQRYRVDGVARQELIDIIKADSQDPDVQAVNFARRDAVTLGEVTHGD